MAHEVEIDGKSYLWKGLDKARILEYFAFMDKIDGDPDNPRDVVLVRQAFATFGLDKADLDEIIQEWRKYKEDKLSIFEDGLSDLDMST